MFNGKTPAPGAPATPKPLISVKKIAFSREKVTFSDEKVTFTILKVTFSGEKVTFNGEKVTLLSINMRLIIHFRIPTIG